jgi:hypothetical protein
LPTTYGTLARDFPNWAQRDTLCAIPLQKVKLKIVNQKAKIVIKTTRGSSPHKALSIHTTDSPSQSRKTVALNKNEAIKLEVLKYI